MLREQIFFLQSWSINSKRQQERTRSVVIYRLFISNQDYSPESYLPGQARPARIQYKNHYPYLIASKQASIFDKFSQKYTHTQTHTQRERDRVGKMETESPTPTVPHVEPATPSLHPLEISFPLPKTPYTTLHIHLTFLATSTMVFLSTTTTGESGGEGGTLKPMGSFVYAMPDVSQKITIVFFSLFCLFLFFSWSDSRWNVIPVFSLVLL